ncbi:MAG: DNA primase [Halohasta sp.]
MSTPLYARYPFLEAARPAVGEMGVDIETLITEGAPAVDRGRKRVERALLAGRVDAEEPDEWRDEDELLSYPIARILVSLLDSGAAIEKYAAAEAKTAVGRLRADFEAGDDGLRSTTSARLDRETILEELDLSTAIRPESTHPSRDPEWFRVGVGNYLRLASGDRGDDWRLVNREVVGGDVRVAREELFALLQTAIQRRIAEGLPFEGLTEGEGIVEPLESDLAELRRLLSERTVVGKIDFVNRELFPPCIENLLQKAEDGIELEGFESFTLMAFLTGIGMDADEIVEFCAESSLDPEGIRYQTEYLKDDRGTQYPPPSCETLSAYGICHNEDDHWKVASHPLAYYQARLDENEDELIDWRERQSQPAE